MKILISAYACEPNQGSEPGVGWNVVQQVSGSHEVHVLTRANNRAPIEEVLRTEAACNARFLYFDLPRWLRWWKRGSRGINLYYYLWQFGAYWKARRLHRAVDFDVIHHVTFVKYWMPSFLALLPVPFLWGPVGGGESYPRSFNRGFNIRGRIYEATRDLARWLGEHDPFVLLTAKRSRVALAATMETARRLEVLGCRTVRVQGAIGLDQMTVERLRSNLDSSGEGCRFLSIGRLLHWKGFHLSLQAFVRSDLHQAEYWVIGDGPERKRLEAISRESGVSERVKFLGALPRPETLRCLLKADVLVHPSLHDSGGYVCLEGMAAGKPVLCLELGGPAVHVSKEAGIRIPVTTPERVIQDLSEAMGALARDRERCRRMGEAGRKLVKERYVWERRAQQYGELYQLASGREPDPTLR